MEFEMENFHDWGAAIVLAAQNRHSMSLPGFPSPRKVTQ
jgi:hypothetical protein